MFKQRTYTTQRSLLLHISSARQSSVAGAGNTLKAIAAGLGLAGTLAVGALCMPTFAVAETPAAETANATSSTAQTTAPADTEAIYRLYNSWSGEHLYTREADERAHLIQIGWRDEGIGWYASLKGDAIYRLYNPYEKFHLYTANQEERDNLMSKGWLLDRTTIMSGGDHVMYRELNPYERPMRHNWTTNKEEHDRLVKIGWVAEEDTSFRYVAPGVAPKQEEPTNEAAEKEKQGAFAYFRDRGDIEAYEALTKASYAQDTHEGDPKDATSIENVRACFKFLRMCNDLRKKEGKGELMVSRRLMAIAESNANASARTEDHTKQFDVGENLAWGMNNPFDFWYDQEKANFENGSGETGHYKNIIKDEYKTTGFAFNQLSGEYTKCYSQVFDFEDDRAMTIDELENDFNAWLKEIGYTK